MPASTLPVNNSREHRRTEVLLHDERDSAAQPGLRRRIGRHDARLHMGQGPFLYLFEHNRAETVPGAVISPIMTITSGGKASGEPRQAEAEESSHTFERLNGASISMIGKSQQIFKMRNVANLRARTWT